MASEKKLLVQVFDILPGRCSLNVCWHTYGGLPDVQYVHITATQVVAIDSGLRTQGYDLRYDNSAPILAEPVNIDTIGVGGPYQP